MIKIGDQLKSFFKREGLTQESIAGRLGVSQAYIGALLNDRQRFGKKQAQKWSDEFGISSNWLLTGMGPMLNQPKNPFSQMTDRELGESISEVIMEMYTKGEIYPASIHNKAISEKNKELLARDQRIEELQREVWRLQNQVDELLK